MLHAYLQTQNQVGSPIEEYQNDKARYPKQYYARLNEDVNQVLSQKDPTAKRLLKSEVWQGLKWKAETPEKYFKLTESVIVPGSRQTTKEGDERFTRLSIQSSWITGKDVVVQEDVYIHEKDNKVYFIGRPVDLKLMQHLSKFNQSQLLENPPLFHVIHSVHDENQPRVNWEMVRLTPEETNDDIHKRLSDGDGGHIYLQTIRQLAEQPVKIKHS